MANSNPFVSVIIPCFNAEDFVEETIKGVLRQTFKSYEIIVIDDGSTDKSKEKIYKYTDLLQYIYQKNEGLVSARNHGILKAKGEYIAFCDSDDIWIDSKLEKQINACKRFPECGLVSTNGFFINEYGAGIGRYIAQKNSGFKVLSLRDTINNLELFYPSSAVFKKEVITLLSDMPLNKITSYHYDTLMRLRIAAKYKIIYLYEPLFKRRFLKNSTSHKRVEEIYEVKKLTFIRALSEFPEIKQDIAKRLFHNVYSLARLKVLKGKYEEAREEILWNLKRNILFGKNYFKDLDSVCVKLKKLLSPVILLLIISLPKTLRVHFIRKFFNESERTTIW